MVNDNKKYFIFNGKKSSDFDVWASGLNLFSSPERRVERIQVPGRNGELLIEDGSFENVEILFKDCFIPRHFSENFTNLSNYLNRQKGYQRLELSWLPDEYRLAAFHGDVEASLKNWDGMGKFDLAFNCKPQRFLKSGEEPIAVVPIVPNGLTEFSSPLYRLNQYTELDSVTISFSSPNGYLPLYWSTFVVRWYTDENTYTDSITASALSGRWTNFEYDGDASELYGWKVIFTGDSSYPYDYDEMDLMIRGIFETPEGYINYDGYFCRTVNIFNPTGYECRPFIKCYGAVFPIAWIQMEDGEGWTFSCSDYSATTKDFCMDCENEYLYYVSNGQKVNFTNNLTITHTDADNNTMIPSFPRLGADKTTFYVYNTSFNNTDNIVFIYPHWYMI